MVSILAKQVPAIERQLFWRIVRPERPQRAVRSGRWKRLVEGGHYFLFDLGDDPGEHRDLAAEHRDRIVTLKAIDMLDVTRRRPLTSVLH